MTRRRGTATAAALMSAAAVAGCGFGAGSASHGTATLTVTRDYGSNVLAEATDQDPRSSDTVIRLLDRSTDITTRYGGGFVQSIDGLSGDERSGRRYDWFFYVNGIESPVGSADVRVRGGDRIWWDYRDWTGAMSIPAVVGSWPEPFAPASAGSDRKPVTVDCLGGGGACEEAAARLAEAGVEAGVENGRRAREPGTATLRILVGPWKRVAQDPAVDGLRGGPASTGVFATFMGPTHGRYQLMGLDATATPVRDFGPDVGLVAALLDGDRAPSWIVTGSKERAVRRAASLLDARDLRNRYAVAAVGRRAVRLPILHASGSGS
jgi:hypothetical protein